MSKYIDAEELKAEIERLNSLVSYESKDRHDEGLHDAYKAIKNVINSLQQEQPEVDLEEEIERYLPKIPENPYNEELRVFARHFAKWGAEHLADARKTSPKDLEEAAEEFADREYMVGDVDRSALYKGFWHGSKWQKEQMMSEAVEGWVAVDSDTDGKRRVTFFPQKPVRDVLTEYKYWAATRPMYESIKLDSNAFPSLKWEDEPKKVKLIIVKED